MHNSAMKLLRTSVSVFVLAVSNLVLSQSTFIVQFDSVQAGHDASGRSVMETDTGLLVFAWQMSNDGTAKMRSAVYQLGADGTFQERYEIGSGEPLASYFGLFDPVTRLVEGGFASMIVRSNGYGYTMDLARFDEAGDQVSNSVVASAPPEDSVVMASRQLRLASDGGFVFCGFIDPPDAYARALLVKVDSTGAIEWQRTYDAPGQSYEAISVAQYPDGGYVLAGYRLPGNLVNQGWVIRTDSLGNELWRKFYGNRGGGWVAVRIAEDGGIITCSDYRDPAWPLEWQQNLLIKWNANGGIVWQTRANYYWITNTYDMELLPDQSIIGVGSYGTLIGLTKYSAEGDSVWTRLLQVFDTQTIHQAYDVERASDGGFLLTGEASQSSVDPHPGLQTIFVIKTDSLGCVIPGCQNAGVQEYVMDLQDLLRVSPNPASDVVSVSLQLPEAGEVEGRASVQLLDASGRLALQQTVDQTFNQLRATLDVSALPAGTYYLHLRDGKRWLAGSKVVVQQ
jgi:hypothetical protein